MSQSLVELVIIPVLLAYETIYISSSNSMFPLMEDRLGRESAAMAHLVRARLHQASASMLQ